MTIVHSKAVPRARRLTLLVENKIKLTENVRINDYTGRILLKFRDSEIAKPHDNRLVPDQLTVNKGINKF